MVTFILKFSIKLFFTIFILLEIICRRLRKYFLKGDHFSRDMSFKVFVHGILAIKKLNLPICNDRDGNRGYYAK